MATPSPMAAMSGGFRPDRLAAQLPVAMGIEATVWAKPARMPTASPRTQTLPAARRGPMPMPGSSCAGPGSGSGRRGRAGDRASGADRACLLGRRDAAERGFGAAGVRRRQPFRAGPLSGHRCGRTRLARQCRRHLDPLRPRRLDVGRHAGPVCSAKGTLPSSVPARAWTGCSPTGSPRPTLPCPTPWR